VLATDALLDLQRGLSSALESMGIGGGQFGFPQLVESSSKESVELFQSYSCAKPSKEGAYAAALAFMRGQSLDVYQRDMIASALAEPIREHAGAKAMGSKRFASLLEDYEADARVGQLWRLTWYALMSSYFAFDVKGSTTIEKNGWQQLRLTLELTWPTIDGKTGSGLSGVPDWITALRRESALLTENPTAKYASDFLDGNQEIVVRLSEDIGISQSSWFWHRLVLSAVHTATISSDQRFRALIPRLIGLVEKHPVYKDEAIEAMLIRYHACVETPVDENLRNYVVRKDIWRNPKLKSVGIATAWNRVPDPVWQMVLGWVNEQNLRDFFDILAARNMADEGRLAFWSKYMKQISWTRLVFGAETIALKNSNPEIRNLIAREEGAYAVLTANQSVDAFLMGIGAYVVVEFSKKPNAAYVYASKSMKFDRDARYYSGGTDDLKYGFYDKNAHRITHHRGWQHDAADALRRLDILPDIPGLQRTSSSTVTPPVMPIQSSRSTTAMGIAINTNVESVTVPRAPVNANFTIKELEFLLSRFPKAFIKDSRGANGGRLWVEDPLQRSQLAEELKHYGFKWAATRQAWYYMEH
jgi:hypothetical protein